LTELLGIQYGCGIAPREYLTLAFNAPPQFSVQGVSSDRREASSQERQEEPAATNAFVCGELAVLDGELALAVALGVEENFEAGLAIHPGDPQGLVSSGLADD